MMPTLTDSPIRRTSLPNVDASIAPPAEGLGALRKALDAVRGSRRGLQDVVVSAFPQTVGLGTGVLGAILIARGLGPADMGSYALVVSVVGVVSAFSELGVVQTALRYASRAAARGDTSGHMAVLRWSLRVRLTTLLLISTAFYLAAPVVAERFWHSNELTFCLRLALLGVWVEAFTSIPTVYFQSVRRFRVNASVMVAQRLFCLAGILGLAAFGSWSLVSLITVTLLASAVSATVFLFLIPKAAIWPPLGLASLRWPTISRVFASPVLAVPPENDDAADTPATFVRFHMFAVILCALILNSGVWLLGYFVDKDQVGAYTVGSRFTLPIMILLGAINTVVWPRASAYCSVEESRQLFVRTARAVALLCLLLLPYAIFAPMLSPLLFGPKYEGSTLVGQLLCIGYLFAVLSCPVAIIGYNFNLVRIYPLLNLLELVVVVSLNLVLIPRCGIIAPCLGVILVNVMNCAVIYPVILQRTRLR